MKKKYLLTLILFIASVNIYGQDIRINNSFIIFVNDKLATTVAKVQLNLSETNKNKETIDGGYYPGVLYVKNDQEKNVIYADSLSGLTLDFDNYDYKKKQYIKNYEIKMNSLWLKHYPYIILRIIDLKKDNYKYWFEFPGWSTPEMKGE